MSSKAKDAEGDIEMQNEIPAKKDSGKDGDDDDDDGIEIVEQPVC